jgi:hypothetical protein
VGAIYPDGPPPGPAGGGPTPLPRGRGVRGTVGTPQTLSRLRERAGESATADEPG